jgi:hypothetical protein
MCSPLADDGEGPALGGASAAVGGGGGGGADGGPLPPKTPLPMAPLVGPGAARTPMPLSTAKTPRGLAAAATAAGVVSGACTLAQLTTPRVRKAAVATPRTGVAPGAGGAGASGPPVLAALSLNFEP